MTVKLSDGARRALGGAALAAALLAASCGGGEQVNSFHPSRIVAFGDETSLIVDLNNDGNGSIYGVNGTVSVDDQTRACRTNPIWVLSLATAFGLTFPQCNPPPAVDAPQSRIRAAFGARAADLGAQIDAQENESALGPGDMVTVLVGENDIIAEYLKYPESSEIEISANIDAAGQEEARQVNRLADLGAKVLLATAPDVGVTPFGVSEAAAHADTDRAALLTRLTARYNAALRGAIVNDGKRIGLILFDELVSLIAKFPGLDGFSNTTEGACDLTRSQLTPPSILDCTAQTLVPNGTSTYFWADDRHIGPSAQNLLGSSAITRAQNNPF